MSCLCFTLTIVMESDWHVGSGQGRHRLIDRLIDRDRDGLPYAPAATVRGLIRDGAQTLARGLDGGKEAAWADLVAGLLGSEPALHPESGTPETPPVPSRLILSDARLPARVRRHLARDPDGTLRQALTFSKPGVGIGHRSGRAREDFLRFEEVARAGAVLRADGELACPDEHHRTIAAFLVGAAALIERLGGKRRRGMGRCKVSLAFGKGFAHDGATAAEVLRTAEPPTLAVEAAAEGRELGAAGTEDGWTRIPLRLTLESPTVVADEVQGNVVTCQDHIPGGLLLPYVARALEAAGLRDAWARISAGGIRVLPATPEIAGRRSLPVPACWERPKGDKDYRRLRVVSRAPVEETAGYGKAPQHEPVRDGFVSAAEPARLLKSPPRILRMHNTVKDDIQRPHEDVGGVYTYEALEAGLILRSEVWIAGGSLDTPAVRARLKGTARVGRARQAGYGQVAVDAEEALLDSGARGRAVEGSDLKVWLTSDAVLAPAAMGGGLVLMADAIAGSLGKRGEDLFDLDASWGSLRWRRIDSWQSRWGLPRPTLVAMQAGSVATLKLRQGIAGDDIRRLEAEGIGKRKGEGFGCLVVNHGFLSAAPALTVAKPAIATDAEAGQEEALSGTERAFLVEVHRRAWERCIALRAEHVASDAGRRSAALQWAESKPTMSQLGALRAALGEVSAEDLERARRWLTHLTSVANRKEKWPKEAIAELEGVLGKPGTVWDAGKVWEKLGLGDRQQKAADAPQEEDPAMAGAPMPPPLEGFDPRGDGELARFALRALLLQAIRFHKRELERREAGSGRDAATAAGGEART